MDAQTQDRTYTKLYRIWDRAHNSAKIQNISDKESFFQNVRSLVRLLKEQLMESSSLPIQLILQKTLENIDYMIRDMFELRQMKISEACRKNQPINEAYLYDFEQHYYRQLLSAFKGYSKSSHLILQDFGEISKVHETPSQQKKQMSPPLSSISSNTPDSSSSENILESFPGNVLDEEKHEMDSEIDDLIEADMEFADDLDFSGFQEDKNAIESRGREKPTQYPNSFLLNSSVSHPTTSSFPLIQNSSIDLSPNTFVEVFTLTPIPPFVSVDMQVYGPFQKDEYAFIPYQNAMIFKEENMLTILTSHE